MIDREEMEWKMIEQRIARQSIGVTHDAVDLVRPVDDAARTTGASALPVFVSDQRAYSPAGQDITILWKAKYGYVPASELPEIKAKHDYFLNRRWNDKPTEPVATAPEASRS